METISLKGFEHEVVFTPKELKEQEQFILEGCTIEQSLIKLNAEKGIKVQSVCIPAEFSPEIISEKSFLFWLSNTIHNEFYSSRVLFLKYNAEGNREDWQNNKATNRRYMETKTLYKKGLYFNKLFQNNDESC
jgi:hypothetical protein